MLRFTNLLSKLAPATSRWALLVLVLAGNAIASAGMIYDFQLPANGAVGAARIKVFLDDAHMLEDELLVFQLGDDAVLTYDMPTPIDPMSLIGIEIGASFTRIGIALFPSTPFDVDPVLLTQDFPSDFFVFSRERLATGTFSSAGGNLSSIYPLDTASPVGTLAVSDVPEPGTWALLGGGLLGLAAIRRRTRRRCGNRG